MKFLWFRKTFYFVIFLFTPSFVQGQSIQERVTLYFASDSDIPTESSARELNQLAQKNFGKVVTGIQIFAHTDSIGNETYNDQLALRRADAAIEILVSAGFSPFGIRTLVRGEREAIASNNTERGRQLNRRVVVVFNSNVDPKLLDVAKGAASTPKQNSTLESVKDPNAPPDDELPCFGDTTIVLPQGTQITLAKCDWRKVKDCIEVEEFNTAEALKNSGLITMTSTGLPMISGGMFSLSLCQDVCVMVHVPIDPCSADLDMQLWDGNTAGTWENAQKVERVEIDGKEFYAVLMCDGTSGKKNLDASMMKTPNTFFRVKGKHRISEVTAVSDCPLGLYKVKLDGRSRKTLKLRIPCPVPEEFEVMAKGINEQGDSIVMHYRWTKNINKRSRLRSCKCESGKFLFFKLWRKCGARRKVYRLYPSYFEEMAYNKTSESKPLR